MHLTGDEGPPLHLDVGTAGALAKALAVGTVAAIASSTKPMMIFLANIVDLRTQPYRRQNTYGDPTFWSVTGVTTRRLLR